jgi:FkbM family methyltransferase
VIWLPTPTWFHRFLEFYIKTKAGEGFGDMSINGEQLFIKKYVKSSEIIFDVGAHTGSWSEYVLSVNPHAQIHCFEPLTENYEALIQKPFARKMTCNQVGLSDKPHHAKIYKPTMSLYQQDKAINAVGLDDKFESIELTTLDQYCDSQGIRQIDMLKIDAEGHDLAILRGGQELINRELIHRIQFEYGPFHILSKTWLRDFFSFFEGRPYIIYLVLPKGLKEVPEYNIKLENFIYKNFVAIHESVVP